MMTIKKTLLFSVLTILLSACGGRENNHTTAASSVADSAHGKPILRVATELHYPPFNTANENGQASGFDNELIKAIAQEEGYEVNFVIVPWSDIFSVLNNNTADVSSAGLTISDARKQQVDFTDPYFYSGQTAIVKKDGKIKSFDDIKGYKTGVQTDFISDQEWTNNLGFTPENVKKEETVFLNLKDLMNGEVESVLAHSGIADFYVSQYKDKANVILLSNPNSKAYNFAFAVKKGNTELLNKLNDGLKKVRANGTYDKLHAKWFGGMDIGKQPQ